MKQACLLTVVGLAALPVLAKEIVVDASGKAKGSVPTIQKGIAAAAPGDTVSTVFPSASSTVRPVTKG